MCGRRLSRRRWRRQHQKHSDIPCALDLKALITYCRPSLPRPLTPRPVTTFLGLLPPICFSSAASRSFGENSHFVLTLASDRLSNAFLLCSARKGGRGNPPGASCSAIRSPPCGNFRASVARMRTCRAWGRLPVESNEGPPQVPLAARATPPTASFCNQRRATPTGTNRKCGTRNTTSVSKDHKMLAGDPQCRLQYRG